MMLRRMVKTKQIQPYMIRLEPEYRAIMRRYERLLKKEGNRNAAESDAVRKGLDLLNEHLRSTGSNP